MEGHRQEAPTWPLAAGTRLGKYQIVRLVGEGGMGAVYEGVHLEIGKKVAIKTISPAIAAIPGARARFVREAQLTSRVRHPHTVDVTDVGTEGEETFLVMEYLQGEDLAKALARRGPLPITEVVDVLLPVLAAVAAAHEEGIVHRDLKPHNIFLARTREGALHPKVLDFGISKAPGDLLGGDGATPSQGASLVATVGVAGSPSYFSPEQVQDSKNATAASDQYALGVILYECLTGRLPYEGDDLASVFHGILAGKYLPARHYRPDLPEGLQQVISRAMSMEPADRFPNVKEMGRALLAYASTKSRLLWEANFGNPPPRLPALRFDGEVSPVPVTEQTPQRGAPAAAMTAFMGSPPTDLPHVWEGESSIAVPRRPVLPWLAALGAVVLIVTGLFLAFGGRGHSAAESARRTSPPPPVSALPAASPPAPDLPAKPSVAARATGTGSAVEIEPTDADESDKASARKDGARRDPAPSGKKLRFGPNRSPLID